MGGRIIVVSLALLLCAPILPLPRPDRDRGWAIDVGSFHLLSLALLFQHLPFLGSAHNYT